MTAAVGLTGGIGSGKSTVASMFAALTVPVLDLDTVGRQLTGPGEPGLHGLVACFGKEILADDGTLDRARLAALCFSDAQQTARLNGVMHPLIREEEQRWLQRQSAPYALIEASVLLESGAAARMDAVVVVLADEALRCERVLARGRQSREMFESIVARQCTDGERRQQADYVLENSGSLDVLQGQVALLHERLTLRFGS